MDVRKLSLLLMLAGGATIVLSVVWFFAAYADIMDATTQFGGWDMGARLMACLYSSPDICSSAGYWGDGPSYSPVVFWIGVIALLAGVIIRFSALRSVATDTSIGLTAVDGNILGIIPEQKYARITYIFMLTGAVGGLLLPPLMVAGVVGFVLGLLGLFVFRSRLSELDCNHLAAICAVFAAAIVLLLITTGGFLFLLVALAQAVLYYIGFNSHRHSRTISAASLKDEAELAIKPIRERFSSKHER